MNCLPFKTNLLHYPYFLSKLKAHIASPTLQNWGNPVERYAPPVSFKPPKHLPFTHGFKHASQQCF